VPADAAEAELDEEAAGTELELDGELEHAARSTRLAAPAAARHLRYIVGLSGLASDERVGLAVIA